jgi:hypothetical protein
MGTIKRFLRSKRLDAHQFLSYTTRMTLKDVTIAQVEKALREVANERPNFVYNDSSGGSCYYHKPPDVRHPASSKASGCETHESGCIFGEALKKLGFTEGDLKDMTDSIAVEWDLVYATNPPRSWSLVQQCQDNGYTWGKAIKNL